MARQPTVTVAQSTHTKNNGEYDYTVIKTKNYTEVSKGQLLSLSEVNHMINIDVDVIIT